MAQVLKVRRFRSFLQANWAHGAGVTGYGVEELGLSFENSTA